MARRIVDYIFKASRDDVGPRFKSLERAQRGFNRKGKQAWNAYERDALRSMSNIARGGKRTFNKLGREARSALGGKIAGALGAAALGVGIKKSIVNLANLGDEMTGIAIKLGQPVESLEDVRKEIEKFSLELGVQDSAAGIARGVNLLVGADFELADALDIVKIAAKGASIAQTDTATITSGLSDIMTGFAIPASRAEEVLSKMIRAGDLGKVELRDLSGAMGDVIPAAKKMGASLDQVLGFLSALSVSGVSNVNEVSTSIGRLFARFARSDFADTALDFGIEVADKKGKLKDPFTIMELILKKSEELKEGLQRNKFLEELVPEIRADRALTPLLDKTSLLRKNIDEIAIASKRFGEAFAENIKRLNVKFSKFQNSISFLSRDFATLFEPGIDLFSKFVENNFDPTRGGQTLADMVRGTIKEMAEAIEKDGLGVHLWKTIFLDSIPAAFEAVPGALVEAIKDAFNGAIQLQAGQQGVADFLAGEHVPIKKMRQQQKDALSAPFNFLSDLFSDPPKSSSTKLPLTEEIKGNLIVGAQRRGQDVSQLPFVLNPQVRVNVLNKIEAATGKTKTTVTVDQTDLARRMPIGETP